MYKATITQGTFVGRLINLISKDPQGDRDKIKRGLKIDFSNNDIDNGLIFRAFFAEENDWAIYKTLLNYFSAVKENFSIEWSDNQNPLSRTIGYGALMKLLVPIFKTSYRNDRDISFEHFSKLFSKVYSSYQKSNTPMTFDNFPASGAGETKLYNALKEWSGFRD